MRSIVHQGHKIEVHEWGREKVFYDNRLVSQKWSLSNSPHMIVVLEYGEQVSYEVEIRLRWHLMSAHVTIRRNGIIIYKDR